MAQSPAVEFILKAKDLASKEIENVTSKLTGLNTKQLELVSSFTRATGVAGVFASTIGGAALATFKAASQFGDSAVHLERMSGVANSSAADVQKLEYVFRRIGLTVQDATRAIGFMAYSIGRDKKALGDLGIFTDNAVEALKQLGVILGKTSDAGQRMRISVDLLGRAGRVFAGVVPQMTAAVQAVDAAIAASGGAVTQHMAEMGFEFNNRADDIQFRLENLSLHLRAALVPAATTYLTLAKQMLDAVGGLVPVLSKLSSLSVDLAEDLNEFFGAMDHVVTGLRAAIPMATGVANALSQIVPPLGELLNILAKRLVFNIEVKPPDFDAFKTQLDKLIEIWKNSWRDAFKSNEELEAARLKRENERRAGVATARAQARGEDVFGPVMGPFQEEATYAILNSTTRMVDENGRILELYKGQLRIVGAVNEELRGAPILLKRTAEQAAAANAALKGGGEPDLDFVGELNAETRAKLSYEKILGIDSATEAGKELQAILFGAVKSADDSFQALKDVADLGPVLDTITPNPQMAEAWKGMRNEILKAVLTVEEIGIKMRNAALEKEIRILSPDAPAEIRRAADQMQILITRKAKLASMKDAQLLDRDVSKPLADALDEADVERVVARIAEINKKIREVQAPEIDLKVALDEETVKNLELDLANKIKRIGDTSARMDVRLGVGADQQAEEITRRVSALRQQLEGLRISDDIAQQMEELARTTNIPITRIRELARELASLDFEATGARTTFIGPMTQAEDFARRVVELQRQLDALEFDDELQRKMDQLARTTDLPIDRVKELAEELTRLDFEARGIEAIARAEPDMARVAAATRDLFEELTGSEEQARDLYNELIKNRLNVKVMSDLAEQALMLSEAMEKVVKEERARRAIQNQQPLLIRNRLPEDDRATLEAQIMVAILEDYAEAVDRALEKTMIFKNVMDGIRDSLTSTFQESFLGVIHGTMKFSEAMKNIFRDLVDTIIKELAKILATAVFGIIVKIIGAVLGASIGGPAGGAALFGTAIGGLHDNILPRALPTREEGALLHRGRGGISSPDGFQAQPQTAVTNEYNIYTYDARDTIQELQSGSLRKADEHMRIVRAL